MCPSTWEDEEDPLAPESPPASYDMVDEDIDAEEEHPEDPHASEPESEPAPAPAPARRATLRDLIQALGPDTASTDETTQCLRCEANRTAVRLLPCKHAATCVACTLAIFDQTKRCCICFNTFGDVLKK